MLVRLEVSCDFRNFSFSFEPLCNYFFELFFLQFDILAILLFNNFDVSVRVLSVV